METLYCQLCAATNLFLNFKSEKPSVHNAKGTTTLKDE